MERHPLRADLALLCVSLIWGATFLMVKEAVLQMGVFTFLALRFLLAASLLVLLFPHRLRASSRQDILSGVLVGLFLFGGYALQTIGLRYTLASKAGFITGLSVVIVPFLSALPSGSCKDALRRRPKSSALLGVALATLGLGLLTIKGAILRMAPGDLLVLGGALAFALQIVALGRFAPLMDEARLATIQIATVFGLSLLLAWAGEGWPSPISGQAWFAILFTGVLGTSLAFLIQGKAQKSTSPTHTALIFVTEPVFAALFGYLLAGERLGPRSLAGCTLILAGMVAAETDLLERGRLIYRRR